MNIFRFEVKSNPDVSKKITDSNGSINVNLVKVKRIIKNIWNIDIDLSQ